MWIGISVLAGILIVVSGLMLYGNHQMSKIPQMSFTEVLEYTTQGEPEAVITVGILKDGKMSYTVYGEDAVILPEELHTYEIGSLTKTVTASLVQKAIQEGKMNLDDTIDRYLEVPEKEHYPTVRQLVTHTSGYKGFYFESPMTRNFFSGRNDFYGIGDSMIEQRVAKVALEEKKYEFKYSNFGYAVLGLILEKVYKTEYTTLMNQYVTKELGLANTRMSDGTGDLGNYWDWVPGDTYMAAGGLTSNIEDMLNYAGQMLEENESLKKCQESLCEIHASSKSYELMGIRMDEIGMGWIIDKKQDIIWHNGGTGSYNCYIGVKPEEQCAVVVLSNLAPNKKIPATVLGIKLLEELTNTQ